jgi:hypothetical protein
MWVVEKEGRSLFDKHSSHPKLLILSKRIHPPIPSHPELPLNLENLELPCAHLNHLSA